MLPTAKDFYKVGGPLSRDAESYVVRDADRDLFDALKDGNYCYVLTSRQMGKTSLLRRTAMDLSDSGFDVAELDLSATGRGATIDEWYYTLLITLCRAVHIDKTEAREFWKATEGLTYASRYLEALVRLVIPRVQRRLTIFVDELDIAPTLPFSADDFFMGIRASYNRRAGDPAWNKINYCLLGVTSPAQLINDPLITPFNIGQRIALHDFTFEEAASLANNLGQDPITNKRLFSQIYYWTTGHPYLTQKLCSETAARKLRSPREIDHLCHGLFFTSRMDKDSNLELVEKELARRRADLDSEEHERDLSGRLDLYRRILKGKPVPNQETRPHVTHLNLSGVVADRNGYLKVRNRIYERAFDTDWIGEKMPDAEARRQRAARRHGFIRGAIWASVVIAVFGGVLLFAIDQRRAATKSASELLNLASKNRRYTYNAIINKLGDLKSKMDQSAVTNAAGSSKLLDASLVDNMRELLGQAETEIDNSREIGGFEFGYFKRYLSAHEILTLRGHNDEVVSVAFSPDGTHLASTSLNLHSEEDNRVKIWDARTGDLLVSLNGHEERVWSVAWSPDNARVATASSDKSIKVWDIRTGRMVRSLQHGDEEFSSVAWSPDGKYIAGGAAWPGKHSIYVWETANGELFKILSGHKDEVYSLAWSPDGSYLASGSWDSTIKIWLTQTWSEFRNLTGHTDRVYGVAWSPDGKEIASASYDKTIRIWSIATSRERPFLRYPHPNLGGEVYAIAWSRDGQKIATGHFDGTINVWDALSGARLYIYSHEREVRALAFSPDGERLASGSQDQTVRVWGFSGAADAWVCHAPKQGLKAVAWSAGQSQLAFTNDRGDVEVWDVHASTPTKLMTLPTTHVKTVEWSPNGELLATVRRAFVATEANSEKESREELAAWDPHTGTQLFSVEDKSIKAIAWSKNGERLAFGSGTAVKIFNVNLRRIETTLLPTLDIDGLSEGNIYRLAWSPNNNELAAAYAFFLTNESSGETKRSAPTTIIWSVETKQPRLLLSGSSYIGAMSWSPTGEQLAIGDEKTKITVWDTTSGKMDTLHGHTAAITALSWSLDGKRLASASVDRSVKVWDPTTAAALLTFDRQPGANFVGWLNGDQQLAAVRGDGTVVIWNRSVQ